MDFSKLVNYTEVEEDYFEDGRADIMTSYLFAKYNQEHPDAPLISSDAVDPVWWVAYNNFKYVLCLDVTPCGFSDLGYVNFNNLYSKSKYTEKNKPFAFTGFYKIHLKTGEYIYVAARTLKNPSATNKAQTINLFNGYDHKIWEEMANNILPSRRTELKMTIDGVNKGGYSFGIVLSPPEQVTDENGQAFNPPYDPSRAYLLDGGPSPDVESLQQRGVIISLFNKACQKTILNVLLKGVKSSVVVESLDPLSDPLPNQLSKYILQTTINTP